jgi:5-methyltetrahydrofolate--homocysteine methyltransferase
MDARSPELVRAARACDVLLDRDEWGATWIAAHRAAVAAAAAAAPAVT